MATGRIPRRAHSIESVRAMFSSPARAASACASPGGGAISTMRRSSLSAARIASHASSSTARHPVHGRAVEDEDVELVVRRLGAQLGHPRGDLAGGGDPHAGQHSRPQDHARRSSRRCSTTPRRPTASSWSYSARNSVKIAFATSCCCSRVGSSTCSQRIGSP